MEVWVEQLDRDGWATLSAQFNADEVEVIQAELAEAWRANAAHGRGGVRNLLRTHATVRRLAQEGPMRRAAAAVLGPSCGAVRALLFDKTPGANWKVIWHQDLTIAVAARTADEGYGPWSAKEGVVHTQPPVEVLERMVAVRLHLDPCTRRNGPVRVLPGTHRQGRMTTEVIDRCRAEVPEVVCEAALGGLLLFRPLLLHASSPAEEPAHRRVLHVEYGPATLPGTTQWDTWVA